MSEGVKRKCGISLVSLVFVFGLIGFSPTSAWATSCPTVFTSWSSPFSDALGDKIPQSAVKYAVIVENFNDWLNDNSFPDGCSTSAPFAYYETLSGKALVHLQAVGNDAFSVRMTGCMKGQSLSVFHLDSLLAWTRCVMTVSFFPSSTVLVQQLHTVENQINTHAPLAYASAGISFFNNIKSNWGLTSCHEGDIGFSSSVPDSIDGKKSLPLAISLPCQPPSALSPIYKIAVFACWAMVAFFCFECYKRAVLLLNNAN